MADHTARMLDPLQAVSNEIDECDTVIVRLNQNEIEVDPNRVWNEFIGIIADETSTSDPVQKPAHLVFVYESEIQNGGHFQFFENGNGTQLQETLSSLRKLGAHCQANILEAAGELWITENRDPALSGEEFVERALEERYAELDERFHSCETDLIAVLKRYLVQFRDAFVQISDS